ncbi:hypothetical protein AGMMS49938_03810 [Fibrobacterales bacterium]|nr:hypothetical protein AGMMS49938_03810 [Fibrobacterales bacterium]
MPFYDFYLNRPAGKLAVFQEKYLLPNLLKNANIREGSKVLEIGVGRGALAGFVKNLGADYTGIEANEILCEHLNEHGIKCLTATVPPFPSELEKGSFDLVIMCHIFEHFKDWQEALKVLGEIRTLLKSGNSELSNTESSGRLLLFHPDFLDWGADYFDGDYSHSLILTRNRIDNLVQDSGFTIIHRDGFRSFFHRIKPLTWILARLMNCIFGALLAITGNRKFFKPKIAFKLNLLTICEKK